MPPHSTRAPFIRDNAGGLPEDGQTAGAILAGGRSTRMGCDKALIPLGGTPMIERAARTLLGVFARVYILSDRPYEVMDLPTLPDIHKGCGPLGGLHAALAQTAGHDIFLLACDMPFVSKDLVQHIHSCRGSAPAAVAAMDGRVHPLCGVYTRTCLPATSRLLQEGNRSMRVLLQEVQALVVPVTPDLPFYHSRLLNNVNDPGALDELTTAGT